MSGEPDDADLAAAEYALGCLDAEEASALEARAAGDVVLQRSIQTWMARLAPLATTVNPVAPPAALWARLEASIDAMAGPAGQRHAAPHAPVVRPGHTSHDDGLLPRVIPLRAPRREADARRIWDSIGFWRATTMAGLAVAAALAGFIVTQPPATSTAGYLATLSPPDAPAPGFIARSQPDGSIVVVALNPPPAVPNRDLELWALPPGETRPMSLGVMPPAGRRFGPLTIPRDQTQLMISLEPTGGSPTGLPTGPVLFAGRLASLN